MTETQLTERQQQILRYIERTVGERGYPPSVREIGEAVGLASPSTVHSHLHTLQRLGYLRRDPTKPRAIEVTADTASGTTAGPLLCVRAPNSGRGALVVRPCRR